MESQAAKAEQIDMEAFIERAVRAVRRVTLCSGDDAVHRSSTI